ncbi:hypothetical protein WE687_003942 [Escherichia coli H46]|uniref:hypothetical protein n=1 Tax=Escherichia albertii TaxID=208962 RepID=UPI00296DC97B|nr:hypothetical protein [Escherichia coli]
MASGFLGRYHHQIIVCIYFNGRVLNRRKVANHDENPKKAHPKMGKLEARNALRRCHLGAWSTWQLGGLSGRTRPSHAYRRACRG